MRGTVLAGGVAAVAALGGLPSLALAANGPKQLERAAVLRAPSLGSVRFVAAGVPLNGTLTVLDSANSRLVLFSPEGVQFRSVPVGRPGVPVTDLAISRRGTAFVIDGRTPAVLRYGLGGTELPPLLIAPDPVTGATVPSEIAAGAMGILAVRVGATTRLYRAGQDGTGSFVQQTFVDVAGRLGSVDSTEALWTFTPRVARRLGSRGFAIDRVTTSPWRLPIEKILTALQAHAGGAWIGTNLGALRLDRDLQPRFRCRAASGPVVDVVEDKYDTLSLVTATAVEQYKPTVTRGDCAGISAPSLRADLPEIPDRRVLKVRVTSSQRGTVTVRVRSAADNAARALRRTTFEVPVGTSTQRVVPIRALRGGSYVLDVSSSSSGEARRHAYARLVRFSIPVRTSNP